jgi:hypothetical protein
MSTVLENFWNRLSGKVAAHTSSKEGSWRKAVAAIADGKPPSAEDAHAVCLAAGKTVDDLKAAAELLVKRRTAKKAVDAGRTVPAERERIHAAQLAADAALEVAVAIAQEKHDNATLPLRQRTVELTTLENRARDAERFLQDTAQASAADQADHEKLRAELDANRQRERYQLDQAGLIEKQKYHTLGELQPPRGYTKPAGNRLEELQATFKAQEEQIAVHQEEAARIRGERVAIEARIAAVDTRALEP